MSSAFEFEGTPVTDFIGRIPAITVECPEPYARGTVLKLAVEVRVKSVRLEENREEDLVRQHVFSIEDVKVEEVVSPDGRQLISGSAAGHVVAGSVVTGDGSGQALPAIEGQTVVLEGQMLIDPETGEVVEAILDSSEALY
jgi:hypothetical protein